MTFIDDDEAEEIVAGLSLTIDVPDSSDSANAQQAAVWIRHPGQMLADLTQTYNGLVSMCHAELIDGVVIRLKPEYRDPLPIDLCGIAVLQGVINTLKVIEQHEAVILFPSAAIVAVRDAMHSYLQSDWTAFDNSLRDYRDSLRRLADCIECRRLLSQPEAADNGTAKKKPSATFDDVVRAISRVKAENGGRATKEKILNALREDFTIGSGLFQKYRTKAERQSAVRPPE